MTLQKIQYRAVDLAGHPQTGIVEAASVEAALLELHGRNLQVFAAEAATGAHSDKKTNHALLGFAFNRANLDWRLQLYRQLAVMLNAGVVVDRALRVIASQAQKPWEKSLHTDLGQGVSAGQPLSFALAKHVPTAGPDEIGLIKAAEKSASLAQALGELASMLERRRDIRSRVVSALVYPAFLLLLAPIALIIVGTVLVPNIAPLFEATGADMPLSLRAMVVAGQSWQEHMLLWLALLALIAVCVATMATNQKRRGGSLRILRKLPLFGVLQRKALDAKLCRPLGSLLKSGAPLQSAIAAVEETLTSENDRDRLSRARSSVSSGGKLSTALGKEKLLQGAALQMIVVGEETNQLDTMLLHVADAAEKELQMGIDRLMTLLVPVLTIAIGLLIGGIMMSVMRAILAVNQLAAQ
jgi:general secretion pathway protein F